MARGWESKAVEAQQAAAIEKTAPAPPVSPEEAARRDRRASLMLARTKACSDLQHACRPAHRAMLEQAVEDIDRQLAALG